MKPKYEDFVLTIDGTPDNYTVAAWGPDEIRLPEARFEYRETEELRVELNRIKAGFAPSRDRMQAVGELLFKALFPYEILPAYVGAKRGLPADTFLRLKLIVRPAELSNLPWELTYDILDQTFMAARSSRPIVRYVERGTPPAPLLSRRPLRVLHIQANPLDTIQLDTSATERALREALGAAGEVTAVRSTTPAALRDALREGRFHVLHYDGHGRFDEASHSGYLSLHGPHDETFPLDGEVLATYLDGSSIRLVVLSACETAADSTEKRFSGIAQQLMRTTSLPAVVAMQYEIPDASALAFTGEFYRALADDYPVDAAVVEGRKAILEVLGRDPFSHPDWATPVLFMRVKDGEILQTEEEEGASVSEEREERGGRRIDTGGGAYVEGGVTVSGGDFVGRDQVVYGDKVHGVAGDELAKLFAGVYQQIEERPKDPDVGKEELVETVQKIEVEAAKGEGANPSKVERWLKFLGSMAPDILEVAAAALANPMAGVATAIRKIAEKAKAEAGSA